MRREGARAVGRRIEEQLEGGTARVAAESEAHGRREVAAGAVPADGDARGIQAETLGVREDPARRGDGVVVRGRERVLGREAVIEREDDDARAVREGPTEAVVRVDRAYDPPAAVEVDDGGGAVGGRAGRRIDASAARAGRPREGAVVGGDAARGPESSVGAERSICARASSTEPPAKGGLQRVDEPEQRLELQVELQPVRRVAGAPDDAAEQRRGQRGDGPGDGSLEGHGEPERHGRQRNSGDPPRALSPILGRRCSTSCTASGPGWPTPPASSSSRYRWRSCRSCCSVARSRLRPSRGS